MHNKEKTHCPQGHEYTEANTKLIKSSKPGKFKRQCRACRKIGKTAATAVPEQAPSPT